VERLTAIDYYREALDILGELGSEALTIASLCERLAVTKGSFYHHFESMPGFVTQLLGYWETEYSDWPAVPPRSEPDPALRLAALLERAAETPHAQEAAIRAWGRSNAEVAEVVAQIDKRRERRVADAVAALGVSSLTRLRVPSSARTRWTSDGWGRPSTRSGS
jgi:AcrR family transcriptional regulator